MKYLFVEIVREVPAIRELVGDIPLGAQVGPCGNIRAFEPKSQPATVYEWPCVEVEAIP